MSHRSTLGRSVLDGLLLAGLSLGGLYLAVREGLAPRDPAAGMAVVFAPWTSPEAVLARSVEAGGRFVRFGGAPFVAVVIPEHAQYAAHIASRGAWFVADPQALAACLPDRGGEAGRT